MELSFENVKPNILNWLMVTIMAITGITFWKFLLTKYPVAGLTQLVTSV